MKLSMNETGFANIKLDFLSKSRIQNRALVLKKKP
jgi:hypothetical protein